MVWRELKAEDKGGGRYNSAYKPAQGLGCDGEATGQFALRSRRDSIQLTQSNSRLEEKHRAAISDLTHERKPPSAL